MPSSYKLPAQPLPPPDVLKHLPPVPPSIQLQRMELSVKSNTDDEVAGKVEGKSDGLSLYKSEDISLGQDAEQRYQGRLCSQVVRERTSSDRSGC